MATIKYQVKENKTLGTHSFYAQAVSYSTLDFQDLADEVTEGTGIDPDLALTVLNRYMRVAKRNVLRGHRVKLGDLLTIYPQISCSIKDELNDDGTVKKAATLDMFNVIGAKGSIGATIAQSVQQSFASSVQWKRVADTDDEETADGTGGGDDNTGGDNPDPATTLQAPTISGDTEFDENTTVTITAAEGAQIRYTNDGTEPTAESTLYSEPFSIARTMTIKAIAILDGQTSPVASQLFTLNSNGE
jgi:hypothetical protein